MPHTPKGPERATAVPPAKQRATPAQLEHLDEILDEALIESFPASDPIAVRVTRVNRKADKLAGTPGKDIET